MTLRSFLKIWMGRKGLIRIQLLELGFGLVLSKGAYSLLVMCRRRVIWFGCHVGEDVLSSLLVCSIMGKVPGGEVEKEENVCGSWAEEELVMLVTLSHWMVLSGFVSYKRTLLSFGTG